ncbi:hypothetical protein BN946_scf185010.g9 [Trametes cinnabarina]|uniref:Uncharacterized protein n=1 Tax=Pycnoporus cinnabarinus TaxID=5643 RepID=A0A060SS80_PYCCI|nr:hypothetical protein BN946_scf185010.g9 [Trametes cinnabarina]
MNIGDKPYQSCTVEHDDPFTYNQSLEPEPPPTYLRARPFAVQKAAGTDYRPYLKPLVSGELHVKSRGKEIVFAAGYVSHAIRVHFGLEGTIAILRTADYLDIIAQDCPGNSTDPAKAMQMRSFVVPERLTIPGASRTGQHQTLAIFAAFTGEEDTIIFVDHNRLLRLHIMSLPQPWREKDLEPGSKLWPDIWSKNHGPDWIHEREKAEKQLDRWRASTLRGVAKPHVQTKVTHYFTSSADHGDNATVKKKLSSSLLKVICQRQDIFNGYGQHTTHDLLHSLAIWPSMPPAELCADDNLYSNFKQALSDYANQYISPTYRKRCLGTPNQNSPLVYNYKSDDNYLRQYLKVYRKSTVRMTAEEYNLFARSGLFNGSHIIGTPYQYSEQELIKVAYTDVPVMKYIPIGKKKRDPVYSVITAKRPSHWAYSSNVSVAQATDARLAGFSTTIGPASFYMFKQNQFGWKEKGKPGRIPLMHYANVPEPLPRENPTAA